MAWRSEMQGATRSQGLFSLTSGATRQFARQASSPWVATKLRARFADLLGIVVPATTFVVRLVIIAIWSVTRFVEELISASLANHENLFHQVTIVITWE